MQVFALLPRPKPDHKYKFYWNIYHHITGYTVIGLSIYNVLKGLGSLSALLEAVTWFIVIKRKESREKLPHNMNGANGHDSMYELRGSEKQKEQSDNVDYP
ncbi:hypothetical protein Q3G72_004465 [Acer saccharum]|nr:hypothetical protein Q3G72_004465 [Acer saccharum]